MQPLASDLATTFLDDATALISGCGRIAAQAVMAPVERIASACDVAGVLAARRTRLHLRTRTKRAWAALNCTKRLPRREGRRCVLSFRFLSDLT
jgi:hypothetical protein